ncbi:YecR-like lipofamily protein (plasmid) [Xanthomonas oryzae pv. oryzicola]|nr:YecR-like lipofamily protein [Xanthomonas oryzae pv. oryzicola]
MTKGEVMKIFALAAIVAVLASGCASTKNWSATGGSRADATVRLSYEYTAFEKPQTNETEAINLATSRCKTWGYTGAEAFGGITQQCNMPGGMGRCQRFLVTKEFQCIGLGNKEPDVK